MEFKNDTLCSVISSYYDIKQIKQTLNNINPKIVTLKIDMEFMNGRLCSILSHFFSVLSLSQA